MPRNGNPESARVRIGNSARGHRIPLRCYGLPSGTAPSLSGMATAISISAAKSKKFEFQPMNQNVLPRGL